MGVEILAVSGLRRYFKTQVVKLLGIVQASRTVVFEPFKSQDVRDLRILLHGKAQKSRLLQLKKYITWLAQPMDLVPSPKTLHSIFRMKTSIF